MIAASRWAPVPADRSPTGRALFLVGIFLMITGDGPPPIVAPAHWLIHVFRFLAWPWLYLAVLAAALVILVASGGLRVRRGTPTEFWHPALTLVVAAFLLSVLFSRVPPLSWFAFACLVAVVGFCLVAAQIVEDEPSLTATSIVIALAAAFLAVRVIVWRLGEGLTSPALFVRNNAWLGKLQIAWVLNLLAPLLLAKFIEERVMMRSALYAVAWLLSGTALYVLFSRVGSLAFAFTTLSLCALNLRCWRRWSPLLATFGGLAIVLITVSGSMSTHVVASLIRAQQDTGMVMRYGVWRETVQIIVDHPIIGIGLGTYDDVAYSQYSLPKDRHFFRNGWHAHNVFLHMLAETGAVGFLAWCYLWYTIARYLIRRWREGDPAGRLNGSAALCVLLAFFILSMTEDIIAARVYGSLRMSLALGLLVVYGVRRASPAPSSWRAEGDRRRSAR